MKTDIQETELYKKFKKALNIQHDMRPDDNPFVVACCEIAEEYAKDMLIRDSTNERSVANVDASSTDDGKQIITN